MAYTKNTWATGDVVTAAKLNHMEDGIAGAGSGGSGGGTLLITLTDNGGNPTVDKTFAEITAAIDDGIMPILIGSIGVGDKGYYYLNYYEEGYAVTFNSANAYEVGQGAMLTVTVVEIATNDEVHVDSYAFEGRLPT